MLLLSNVILNPLNVVTKQHISRSFPFQGSSFRFISAWDVNFESETAILKIAVQA